MMLHFSFWAALVLLTRPSKAIIGGTIDNNNTFPSHGALMIDRVELNRTDKEFGITCSGVLIHEKVFLTAGHCIASLFPEERDLVDLDGCPIDRYRTDRDGPGVWVSFHYKPTLENPEADDLKCETCLDVARVVNHPNYAPHQTDIGVIILKEAVPVGLEVIKLPEEGLLDRLKREKKLKDAKFMAVGYGSSFGTTKPPYEIVYLNERKYTDNLSYLALDSKFFTLAMKPAHDQDGTCYGDSGGGRLIYQNNEWNLVGLTSWGDVPCVATDKVVRLDTASASEFLAEVLAMIDSNPSAYDCQ